MSPPVRLVLSGATGRMGTAVAELARSWVKRRYRILLSGGDHSLDALVSLLKGMELGVQVEAIERRGEVLETLVRLDGPAARHDRLLPLLAAEPMVRRAMRG